MVLRREGGAKEGREGAEGRRDGEGGEIFFAQVQSHMKESLFGKF